MGSIWPVNGWFAMTSDTVYYDECPICEARFIGATAADMVEHFVDEHPTFGSNLTEKLGISTKERLICNDCGREYVSYQGQCPWCRNGGPPYK